MGEKCNRGVATKRVDRSSGSRVGNPFRMADEGEREAVCDAYEELLLRTLRGEGPGLGEVAEIRARRGLRLQPGGWDAGRAVEELIRLRDVAEAGPLRLDCWCAPRRCHAESVRAALLGEPPFD